jgi:hypothetical protein
MTLGRHQAWYLLDVMALEIEGMGDRYEVAAPTEDSDEDDSDESPKRVRKRSRRVTMTPGRRSVKPGPFFDSRT